MSDANQASGGTVVALAGRRIDAPGADPPRFPPERVPAVRQRLVDMLAAEQAAVLVCSAACGADLVALRRPNGWVCGGGSFCPSPRSDFERPR